MWLAQIADEWLHGLLMWRRWARLQWVPPHARALRGPLVRRLADHTTRGHEPKAG